MGVEGIVLYQLRHGGASGDYLEGRRSLQDVAMRGRWRTMASVRRYTKAGRVQKVLQSLPPSVLPFVKWAHDRLEQVMTGDLTGMPPLPLAAEKTLKAATTSAARRRPSSSSSAAAARRRLSSGAAGSTISGYEGDNGGKRIRCTTAQLKSSAA